MDHKHKTFNLTCFILEGDKNTNIILATARYYSQFSAVLRGDVYLSEDRSSTESKSRR